jgi:hypothetical protein
MEGELVGNQACLLNSAYLQGYGDQDFLLLPGSCSNVALALFRKQMGRSFDQGSTPSTSAKASEWDITDPYRSVNYHQHKTGGLQFQFSE